jgi:hypothetical protein
VKNHLIAFFSENAKLPVEYLVDCKGDELQDDSLCNSGPSDGNALRMMLREQK